jgi:hypothetical protein
MSRWDSWSSSAPLWGTGIALVVLGVALILAGRKVTRG